MLLLFDIGGTKTRIGISRKGKKIDKKIVFFTPSSFREGVAMIKKNSLRIAGQEKITKVIGGIAGPLNTLKTRLVSSPHLLRWVGKPLKKELKKVFSCPVFLENDADLGGLGEACFGAGKGKQIVAYVALGTGIGGVRITKNQIDNSFFGFEPGHQIIDLDQSYCPQCSSAGWEDYISGAAIFKKHGKKPESFPSSNLLWKESARVVAYGLHNVILFWSPQVVVLGGSLMKKISISEIRKNLKKIMKIFPDLPLLRKAKLGDLSGLYGAIGYEKFVLKK